MFKRRSPLSVLEQIREFFWPSMGWSRAFTYLKHRVIRISDTQRNIALGLAIGAGVSFSPVMMTHFIQGAILAYILRANIPAALIGTIVGNPWTFPFIWWASITVGANIFAMLGLPASTNLPDDVTFSMLWDMIWDDPMRIFMPWMLGGYILCVIVIAGTYPLYFNLVKGARLARKKARIINAHKTAKEITGQQR